MKSAADRQKARQQRVARKAKKELNRLEQFEAEHPGLHEWMRQQSWSSFIIEMSERARTHGLTERQLAAVLNTKTKAEASRAARAAEHEASKTEVDLSSIRAMFNSATSKGLKTPKYRAEGISLSLASAYGKNPGAIYVKRNELYLGKVVGTTFTPSRDATEADKAALATIAANPLEAAIRYGRLTGNCACCGAGLTNKASIERGIGPICASKWGFWYEHCTGMGPVLYYCLWTLVHTEK